MAERPTFDVRDVNALSRRKFRSLLTRNGTEGWRIGRTKPRLSARRAKRRAHNKVAKAARKVNR